MDIIFTVAAIGIYGWFVYREGHQRGFEDGVKVGRLARIRVASQRQEAETVLAMLKWEYDSNVLTDNREN